MKLIVINIASSINNRHALNDGSQRMAEKSGGKSLNKNKHLQVLLKCGECIKKDDSLHHMESGRLYQISGTSAPNSLTPVSV